MCVAGHAESLEHMSVYVHSIETRNNAVQKAQNMFKTRIATTGIPILRHTKSFTTAARRASGYRYVHCTSSYGDSGSNFH
jgi:hypothetical protein